MWPSSYPYTAGMSDSLKIVSNLTISSKQIWQRWVRDILDAEFDEHVVCVRIHVHFYLIHALIPSTNSGLALESLHTLLTTSFIPFFMLLWIICAPLFRLTFRIVPNPLFQPTCLLLYSPLKSYPQYSGTGTQCPSTTSLKPRGPSSLGQRTRVRVSFFFSPPVS